MHCDHIKTKKLFSTDDFHCKTYDFLKCEECKLIFHTHRSTAQELEVHYNNYGMYSDQQYFQKELKRRQYSYQKLGCQLIEKLGKNDLKVLEIGSANGILLYWLRELFGFEVYGIELDPISSQYAKKLIGEDRVFVGHTHQAPFLDESFDLVIMDQVIEHLAEPFVVLEEAKRALKPGGAIYISTPNFGGISFKFLKSKWKNTSPNDHISMFSVESLQYYLTKSGYSNCTAKSAGLSITARRNGDREYSIKLPKFIGFCFLVIGKLLSYTKIGDGLYAYAYK